MDIKKERSELLGNKPIKQLLIEFSIPAIVGMTVNALYNIVDRIFIGRVDTLAIGGVYVTFPIALIVMAFGMLIGMGGNALSSIRLGEGHHDEAEKILGNSLSLMIILATSLIVILTLFLKPLLLMFGATEKLLPYAFSYIRIIIFGIPLQMIGFGLNNFIRGEGNPRIAMITMMVGAVVNTVLDYIFIIKFGWGVEGAALATIIGQGCSATWVLYYFLGKNSLLKIRRKNLILAFTRVKEIIYLGLSPFSMQLVASIVITFFNHQLVFYGGELATSSMGVIQSITTLCFMPIFGMNQGAQPILGFNYGAKKYDRVKDALKYAIIAGTIYMSLTLVVLVLFPNQLIQAFIPNPKDLETILPIARPGLIIYCITLPILAFPIIGSSYFQSTGKPTIGILLSLSRQLIFLLPSLYILPKFFHLNGVWMSAPVSDFMAMILTGYFLFKDFKKFKNESTSLT